MFKFYGEITNLKFILVLALSNEAEADNKSNESGKSWHASIFVRRQDKNVYLCGGSIVRANVSIIDILKKEITQRRQNDKKRRRCTVPPVNNCPLW